MKSISVKNPGFHFEIYDFHRNISERLQGDQTNQRAELTVSEQMHKTIFFVILF